MVELYTRDNQGDQHTWDEELRGPIYRMLEDMDMEAEHNEFTSIQISQHSETPDVCSTHVGMAEPKLIVGTTDINEVIEACMEETLLDSVPEGTDTGGREVLVPSTREAQRSEEWVVEGSLKDIPLIEVEWT